MFGGGLLHESIESLAKWWWGWIGPPLVRKPTHPQADPAGLRAVRLDDVLDGPPADGTAGIDLLLQLQAALVAQAHVATGVDDRVHLLVEAHGALASLDDALWGGEGGGDRGAQGGAGGRDWKRERIQQSSI